jgi:hypothetical protein
LTISNVWQHQARIEQRRRATIVRVIEHVTRTDPVAAPIFRGDNLAAQTITAPAWILSGPYETGKTWAVLWRLDQEARANPRGQYALVRKVRNDMDGSVLVTWRKVIERAGGGVSVFGKEKPQWYDYPNGARVWVGGLDRPEKTLSGERDGVYVNQAEELTENDWELLTRATTGRGAVTRTPMLFGDCNPGGEDHWILGRKQAGSLTLLVSRHEDNPSLYADGGALTEQGERSMEALNRLTGVRYSRGRLGLWVGAEGAYYSQLDERLHLCDMTRVPSGWRAWGALDYGFAHPLSFGVFTISPEGVLYVVGLHHQARWYVPQHHAAMTELCERVGVSWRSITIYGGHDLWAERGGEQPEIPADKFSKRGWRLERATIARVAGAQALGERLGNPEAGLTPTIKFGPLARPAFQTIARMVPDPHDEEDVKKVDADAHGRGGDDDYDMVRYGVMGAPARRASGSAQQVWSKP